MLPLLLYTSLLLVVTSGQDFTQVNYTVEDSSLRNENNELFDWFKPIRIHVYEVNISEQVHDPSERRLFREIVRDSVAKARELFQVYPVTGTLRLDYRFSKMCRFILNETAKQCTRRFPFDPPERCGDLDGFQIPAEHMEEFRLYTSSTRSTVAIPAGSGVADTDIILYVSAQAIEFCRYIGVDVLAYAEICKRDQFGRPIASFLNVCPTQLSAVSSMKLRETVFHELLHALGFLGSSLSLLLRSCRVTDRLECTFLDPEPSRSTDNIPLNVLKDKPTTYGEHYEFVGRHVNAVWKDHVNCHSLFDEYENKGPAWRMDSRLRPSGHPVTIPGDHWTWTAMMGSLMSPFVKEPYMQVLDNITIALFKDTGWYKVNETFIQPYVWGKNSGCDFSHLSFCQEINAGTRTDRFLCGRSGESGCHFLHLHKGTCSYTEEPERECQYYKPDPQGECFISKESTADTLEEFCENCRCFTSSLHLSQNVSHEAGCFNRRCVGGELEVSVNGTWVRCPYGQYVRVDGLFGTIQCPPSEVLCTDRDLSLYTMLASSITPHPTTASTKPYTTTTAAPTTAKDSDGVVVCASCIIYADIWAIYTLVFLFIQSF